MQKKNHRKVVLQNTGETFLERAGGQLYQNVMIRKEIKSLIYTFASISACGRYLKPQEQRLLNESS